MAEFSVSTYQINSQAEELIRLNNRFRTAVQELAQTEAALNQMWEGESREAFHSAFGRDLSQMQKFSGTTASYTGALQETVRRYQAAERQNLELAGRRT